MTQLQGRRSGGAPSNLIEALDFGRATSRVQAVGIVVPQVQAQLVPRRVPEVVRLQIVSIVNGWKG